MDNQIKSCSDNGDFLSQSYNDGVERIVGFKNNTEFTVSKKVLKKRQQFWDDLCTTYSKPFSSDIEYNIDTLQRCKKLSFVQYWINTSYLPYKAQAEEDKNPENDMSFMEKESLNSSSLVNVKEKPSEYHARLSYDGCSLSSSIDTIAYILSNKYTTNKVETMAILEGAKHNASPNRKDCGNVETLPTTPSKSTESLTQQTNRDNTSSCNSEHNEELFNAEVAHAFNFSRYRNPAIVQKCLNEMYVEQRSMVDESSMLEDNTTKLSSRKKLYSGRDSPVDLVDTTNRNTIVSIKSTKNLHPALDPVSKKRTFRRKRQRSLFSVFHMSKLNKSILSISSYRKRKRRKIARSHVSENSSIMDSSKKRCIPVADKTENNSTKKKSFAESSSPKELLSIESKLDNSVTECDIQKYRSSNKTTARPRDLCPVVCLIPLSDSDIKKYRRPNRETTRPGSLSPIVHLKQPSEFNNPERRKSEDMLDVRFRHPVVRLKKLSEQDIKKYKAEIVRSEYSDTAYVPHNSSTCSNISQPGSKVVHVIGDSDSGESSFLIYKCNSSASQDSRQPSPLTVGVSKNCNLVRKDTSNKYTGLNNSALYQTSETAQNGFRRSMITDSCSTSSCTVERRSPQRNLKTSASSLKTRESVLPEKDARQNDQAISDSDESEIFNNNASKTAGTKRRSHNFILSDEDDEFVNLINYSQQRTNSKIRSPYNSPRKNSKIRSPYNSPRKNSKIRSPYNSKRKNSKIRSPYKSKRKNSKIRSPYKSPQKNSDDSIETRSVGTCTTKSMEDQLLSESIGQNTKFEKQTTYFYRKRRSKNLLYLTGFKSNESQLVLRDRRKLLTSMNINKDKNRLHTLRFQTKIFDSDSDTSCFS